MNKEFPGMVLPKNSSAPFPRGYEAETDVSPVLAGELATSYHSSIGVLRWMVELGRIDMITKVSMLSSHLAMPREGHLSTLFHIFGYLEEKHNTTFVFDTTYPTINQELFNTADWDDFYSVAKEAIALDITEPGENR